MSEHICDVSFATAVYADGTMCDVNRIEELMEPIVRCRDCVHAYKNGTFCTYFSMLNEDDLDIIPMAVEPDGFCAWGMARKRGDRK